MVLGFHRGRVAALVVSIALVGGLMPLLGGSASAADSFTASGNIQFSSFAGVSTTDTEWQTTCPSVPDSQGDDAWVFVLPDGFDVSGTTTTATGATTGDYDLDIYFYGQDSLGCFRTGTDADAGTDESGPTPANTLYVVVTPFIGSNIDVTLTVGSGGVDPSPTPTGSPTTSPDPSPTSNPTTRGDYPEDPNDPLFEGPEPPFDFGQWGMRRIQAPQAWQEAKATGHGIKVAVLDTGLDLGHPDFDCPGKVEVIADNDFIGDGNGPADGNGHGTHVAGIVGACTNNGEGVVGVAPDATIMPIQVLDSEGGSDDITASLPGAIRAATDAGAHVINMSLGTLPVNSPIEIVFGEVFPVVEDAVQYAVDRGVVVVAAAGNETFPLCGYPAIVEDILCVGATDTNDANAWYGNFPVKDDEEDIIGNGVMAPGGQSTGGLFCQETVLEIISTYLRAGDNCGDVGYEAFSGTSMASPHVAGVAALVYDRLNGERTRENGFEVLDAIVSTTDDLYAPGYDPASGYGRVNALGAVRAIDVVEPSPSPTTTTSPSPSPSTSASPTPVVQDTSLTFVDPIPSSGQYTDDVGLAARLVDESGSPISEETVTFQLLGQEGFQQTNAVTGEDGVATTDLELVVPPGDYDVLVGYSGKADTYNSSSDSRPFDLLKEDAEAVATVEGNGSKTSITGTLLDADSSHPVPRGVLAFYADGTFIGEGLTNDQGDIFFDVPPGYRGKKVEYRISFAGDRFFLPSDSVVTKN